MRKRSCFCATGRGQDGKAGSRLVLQDERGVQYRKGSTDTNTRWDETGRDRSTGRDIDQENCSKIGREYGRENCRRNDRECLARFCFRAAGVDPRAPSTSTSSMITTCFVCKGGACVSGFF